MTGDDRAGHPRRGLRRPAGTGADAHRRRADRRAPGHRHRAGRVRAGAAAAHRAGAGRHPGGEPDHGARGAAAAAGRGLRDHQARPRRRHLHPDRRGAGLGGDDQADAGPGLGPADRAAGLPPAHRAADRADRGRAAVRRRHRDDPAGGRGVRARRRPGRLPAGRPRPAPGDRAGHPQPAPGRAVRPDPPRGRPGLRRRAVHAPHAPPGAAAAPDAGRGGHRGGSRPRRPAGRPPLLAHRRHAHRVARPPAHANWRGKRCP